eukprot:6211790-Pleurochrysis_carterae.AAC.1
MRRRIGFAPTQAPSMRSRLFAASAKVRSWLAACLLGECVTDPFRALQACSELGETKALLATTRQKVNHHAIKISVTPRGWCLKCTNNLLYWRRYTPQLVHYYVISSAQTRLITLNPTLGQLLQLRARALSYTHALEQTQSEQHTFASAPTHSPRLLTRLSCVRSGACCALAAFLPFYLTAPLLCPGACSFGDEGEGACFVAAAAVATAQARARFGAQESGVACRCTTGPAVTRLVGATAQTKRLR